MSEKTRLGLQLFLSFFAHLYQAGNGTGISLGFALFACCVPAAFKSPFLGPPGSAALLIPPAALLIPVRYMARGLLFGALIPSMARGACRSFNLLQWAVGHFYSLVLC